MQALAACLQHLAACLQHLAACLQALAPSFRFLSLVAVFDLVFLLFALLQLFRFTEEFRFVTAAAFAALTVCQRDSMGVFASQPVSVLIDETLLRKFPRRGFGIVCNLAPHHGIKVARPADFAPAW